ncbi:uncharacterized protein LOC103989212 [Musa acuminata AAA Group]|uniref:(wild Malaysian banana) hypothetical protein n=1 Tax=Musa acuminata subsp. malaccensis TaxID=214687 RepID=A0A804JLN0_MUSAM|nr:PREDICTED: uncharacterized protein LOC103989212 [Musa acuminata subsp. malaccensis]CAG1847710.1 unnamed protein product [Musa acuminata subsp. malaccensis]
MDAIQAEKETAMRRYRRLQKIGTLLRYLEAVAGLLLFSWLSARLPAAARLSVDFLRRLAAVLLSPRFVFLLGNAIVLLLFAKSGHLSPSPSSSSATTTSSASSSSSSSSAAVGDLFDEFLESRGLRFSFSLPPPQEEVVVYEDKAVCVETRAFRKSRSQRMERRRGPPPELRRAETVVAGRKRDMFPPTTTEASEEEVQAEDAEEFRRAVEAFIAKQTRFHREERMAIASPPFLICSAALPDH